MNNPETIKVIIESLSKERLNLLSILSAFSIPILGIITTYIAFQQHKLDKSRRAQELYDKRLNIFQSVQKFLREIFQKESMPYERILEFYAETAEVHFIFGKDKKIQKYVEEIYEKAMKLESLHLKLYPSDGSKGLPVGEERAKIAKEQGELLNWLMEQGKVSIKKFDKLLQI